MATSRARAGRAHTPQPDETRIAGERTCREWIRLSARLDHGGQLPNNALDEDWRSAIDFIRVRLHTRFVDPLDALRREPYVGFLTVAIDSLLIEALERLRQGKRLEERASSCLVATFLRERLSFKGDFRSDPHRKPLRTCPCVACDFYRSVRSGLVHEGETQNGWVVRTRQSALLHHENGLHVVDRDRFHRALVAEVRAYLIQLEDPAERALRANLLKTLDGVCDAAARRP